jgi:hypothetical protein
VANTPVRTIRISTALWKKAQAKAKREGTNVSEVIVAALKEYVTKKNP